LHTGAGKMYKIEKNKQLSISDFGQSLGFKMNPNNRWVKKSALIPWNDIEVKYASLFKSDKGNVAKPLRMALGSLLIQIEYDFSDVETVFQIQETPYLQYFIGLPECQEEKPFDPSLMVHFRKRLSKEVLMEINEMIISAQENPKDDDDNNNDNEGEGNLAKNNGTMIVDATCAPSQIKYPQDTELLNDCREKLEDMIDDLHKQVGGKKPRTYRKNARKDYLNIARKKKKSANVIRKAIRKQLGYIRRDMGYIEAMQQSGAVLTKKQEKHLDVLRTLVSQQQYMYDTRTHKVENRIVSISQPYLRPIVRGKAKAPVEFGTKLDISVVNGYCRLEKASFDAYNEGEYLIEMIEKYKARTGVYPERVLADKIYRNRENLRFCKENNIQLSGPSLGRPKKDAVLDKKQEYIDNCDRVEVERKYGLAKSKFGLGLIRTRLAETNHTTIALSILAMNLSKILLPFFMNFVFELVKIKINHFFSNSPEKLVIVQ